MDSNFGPPSIRDSVYRATVKSDTVAVLAVLPRYPRYYCGNGYKFYGITTVSGSKYTGLPWGWGPGLRYYRGYGVGFFSCTCNNVRVSIIDFTAGQVVCASFHGTDFHYRVTLFNSYVETGVLSNS